MSFLTPQAQLRGHLHGHYCELHLGLVQLSCESLNTDVMCAINWSEHEPTAVLRRSVLLVQASRARVFG